MNTIIVNIPEKRKELFLPLFNQFEVKHKILSDKEKKEVEIDGWDRMTISQKTEIVEAIAELDTGKSIPHQRVMAKIRKR